MASSVLVLELNELCPPLLDRFIAAGDLPSFERLRRESTAFTTEADEPQDHLNPWIQWVTAHTGVGFDEHGVFKLGDGARLAVPTIADVVGAAGRPVWLCGPMNVVPTRPVRGAWLPDPWNPDPEACPPALRPFARFVRANVQEHTNDRHRLTPGAHLQFLSFMARHGLSRDTIATTTRQLVGERTGRQPRWKRAALLDRFQWDLFTHELDRLRPALATYFSNTTAHFQHLYWRYMEPDAFALQPTEAEIATYGDAIRFGYLEMDRIVGQALARIDDDTALVLCTALSQQPYVLADDTGGSRFYRPRDIPAFVDALGVRGVASVAPVMAAQFHLLFVGEPAAQAAAEVLEGATVAGETAFTVRRVGSDVFTGFAPTHDLPDGAVIDVPATGARLAVSDVLYRSDTPKSGYHHPQGALWVREPGRRPEGRGTDGGTVPLRSVAPTLLDLLGLDPAPTMRGEALLASQSPRAH